MTEKKHKENFPSAPGAVRPPFSPTSNSVSFLHCSAVEPCTLPAAVNGVWNVNRNAPSPASKTSTTFCFLEGGGRVEKRKDEKKPAGMSGNVVRKHPIHALGNHPTPQHYRIHPKKYICSLRLMIDTIELKGGRPKATITYALRSVTLATSHDQRLEPISTKHSFCGRTRTQTLARD